MSGRGHFLWSNGHSYQGNFENDLRQGYGEYSWDGMCYKGYWEKGKQHGKGQIIFPDNTILEGWWKEGEKIQ